MSSVCLSVWSNICLCDHLTTSNFCKCTCIAIYVIEFHVVLKLVCVTFIVPLQEFSKEFRISCRIDDNWSEYLMTLHSFKHYEIICTFHVHYWICPIE